MHAVVPSLPDDQINQERLRTLFNEHTRRYWSATDRNFAGLMVVQFIIGLVIALTVSPHSWVGQTASVHANVWAAVLLGGLLAGVPILLARLHSGRTVTRHVVAVAQMLWCGLLIHLCGGRIEAHFHVFCSLAFLAFYRDWRVLATATLVVIVDQFIRGVYWPQSVFGQMSGDPWRWLEHVSWVLFEDIVLVLSCIRGTEEMREMCRRQVLLENTNEQIEQKVDERTEELRETNDRLSAEVADRISAEARVLQFGRLFEQSVNEIYIFDKETLLFHEVNAAALQNIGYTVDELRVRTPVALKRDLSVRNFVRLLKPLADGEVDDRRFEVIHYRKDGTSYPVEVHLQLSEWDGRPAFVAIVLDITERRRAELERDDMQKQLLETSRMAGMAEVATGVLHNVGNVLNSVNVSTTLIQDQIRNSRVGNLARVAELLKKNQDNIGTFMAEDQKGQMLPGYIETLSEGLAQEHGAVLEELSALSDNVNHIKEIVQTQQSYAKTGGAIEKLPVEKLIDEALRVELNGLVRHGIHVEREYSDAGMIQTQKHKVLQILVNLIVNAKHAIEESGRLEKTMTLRAIRQDNGDVWMECVDTGCGIADENLEKIFGHGFTTRENGHGFGLHSCALAAGELGGSLTAHSDGIGEGATFRLVVPSGCEEKVLSDDELPEGAVVVTDGLEVDLAASS